MCVRGCMRAMRFLCTHTSNDIYLVVTILFVAISAIFELELIFLFYLPEYTPPPTSDKKLMFSRNYMNTPSHYSFNQLQIDTLIIIQRL